MAKRSSDIKKEEEEVEEQTEDDDNDDYCNGDVDDDYDIDFDDNDNGEEEDEVDDRRKRVRITIVSGRRSEAPSMTSTALCCQADDCALDLRLAKRYHRRHKVCERHAKAAVVLVAGTDQRFCQQCSRFHEISQFDDTKRSCRKRLAGHNERRRKTNLDLQTEAGQRATISKMNGSSLKGTERPDYGKVTVKGSPNFKLFQCR